MAESRSRPMDNTGTCHLCGKSDIPLHGTKLRPHFLSPDERCPGTHMHQHETERIFETVQQRLAQ